MTNKEVLEGNTAIAEFMGGKLKPKSKRHPDNPHNKPTWWFDDKVGHFELEYHSSWDWLMPVVEMINVVFGFASTELSNTSREQEGLPDPLDNPDCWKSWSYHSIHPITEDIISVWNRVVKAIKWYNLNKSEQ